MAFAISSGVAPQSGIYCAIVAGFLISALGGSRCQIGGPTGAFVVVVAGIVAHLRARRPVHVHDDGRRHAGPSWRDRHGHGRQLHPAAGRRRVHQRHRRPDREHPDQGSSSVYGSTCRASSGRAWSRWRATPASIRQLPPRSAWRRSRRCSSGAASCRGFLATSSRCSAGRRWSRWSGLPVETIGTRFGGIPSGWPQLVVPAFRRRADPRALPAGADRGHARRDRVADVGGGRRPHERRSAQPERRADRPGHRQHRLAAGRRPARDRRDRADRHEHPLRRADAGGRHDSRADAARWCCSSPRRPPASSRWPRSPESCWWSPTTWATGARSASC